MNFGHGCETQTTQSVPKKETLRPVWTCHYGNPKFIEVCQKNNERSLAKRVTEFYGKRIFWYK